MAGTHTRTLDRRRSLTYNRIASAVNYTPDGQDDMIGGSTIQGFRDGGDAFEGNGEDDVQLGTKVALVGAGLMVRSFFALQQVRPGFDPARVLSFRVSLPVAKYTRPDLRAEFVRRMEQEILRLPGVTHVGLTSQLPLTGSGALAPSRSTRFPSAAIGHLHH